MDLADMTWKDVSDHLKKDKRLIVPTGSCEQHGGHLPVGTDTFVCGYFAGYISDKTGIPVAPAVNYGVDYMYDMLYAGTAGIMRDTLASVMQDMTKWWRTQGFETFILLTYHGDEKHVSALDSIGKGCLLLKLYDIDYTGILEKQSNIMHACEGETSLMMYLFPEKVRISGMADVDPDNEMLHKHINDKTYFDTEYLPGNIGYAKAASAAKGRKIVEKTYEMISEWFINRFGQEL